jgi:hypothetical protein
MHARSRAAEVAVALFAAACALWVCERVVAGAHGVADPILSWRARAALFGLHIATVLAIGTIVLAIAALARGRSRIAMLISAAAIALPAVFAGHALASGPWIRAQWFAPLVLAAPAVMGAALGALSARFAFAPGRAPTLALATIALGSIAADATIAVGHHPAFHLAAWGLAAIATTLSAMRLALPRGRSLPGATVWVMAAIATIPPAPSSCCARRSRARCCAPRRAHRPRASSPSSPSSTRARPIPRRRPRRTCARRRRRASW